MNSPQGPGGPWQQQPEPYPQQPHSYPQQPYPQQPYPPQGYPHQPQGYAQAPPPPPVYGQPPLFPQTAVTKTRRPFDHSKHIKWTVFTLGVWGVTGYLVAWAWNRWGPEKSVSTTRFH